MKYLIIVILFTSCATIQEPTITVQRDNLSHYASYRVYENGQYVNTITYTGAKDVSEKKVIEDHKK